MINGKALSEVASPDPVEEYFPWEDVDGGDASPLSSRYSSCGESEFDRYCSANSVMGTPSLCGSVGAFHDTLDSDLGSIKSFRQGDSATENLGCKSRFDKKVSEPRETKSELDHRYEEFSQRKANEESSEENLFDGDGTSTKYEHSEGEDSMFGAGSDEENQYNHYKTKKEGNNKNETSLGMNSSIAFGSNDWDDFMLGYQENSLLSVANDELQQHQKSVECESHLNSPFPVTNNFAKEKFEVTENENDSSRKRRNPLSFGETGPLETLKNMVLAPNRVESSSVINTFETVKTSAPKVFPLKEKIKTSGGDVMKEHAYTSIKQNSGTDESCVSNSLEMEKANLQFDLTISSVAETKSYELGSLVRNDIPRKSGSHGFSSSNLFEEKPAPIKTEYLELDGFYDEIVNDMEDILLDSVESPGIRFSSGNRTFQFQVLLPPSRDGGSTASTSSTSGTDDTCQRIQHPMKIDKIEVIGAKQKQGDVSFSERLVGVKEFTVYQIKVWSGKDTWVVERRYRDFSTLYRRLKTLFTNRGWFLPSNWNSVDESRKYFGNLSPTVIAERSVLFQECLNSILESRYSSNSLGPLIWFLSPSKEESSEINPTHSSFYSRSTDTEKNSTLGKTLSLIVEIHHYKSTKQLLESQQNACAGCHKHFDDGKTRMFELVQTLGWGGPRLCAYSGQLFCSSCHNNDTAVLPARVLHLWDFTKYPVSQMAKSYLDSIYDQPMLCVSAVNPFLLSKVPALQHVTNIRKKTEAMLPCVRCPFRRNIQKGLGSRRYLLENSDFFALKDLIDLSKGIFAALPVMAETVSRKVLEHITEQCLICYDTGVPCNARLACQDPSALIFPFQEGEIGRCSSCDLVFHKHCLTKMVTCSCGKRLKECPVVDDEALDLLRRKDSSTYNLGLGMLSGLFSRSKSDNSKDDDNVILMGSLRSTSLRKLHL